MVVKGIALEEPRYQTNKFKINPNPKVIQGNSDPIRNQLQHNYFLCGYYVPAPTAAFHQFSPPNDLYILLLKYPLKMLITGEVNCNVTINIDNFLTHKSYIKL